LTGAAAAARFITLEGPEGSGKSTQVERLARRLVAAGRAVTVTREPGGTRVGEGVREVLLAPDRGGVLPVTEALLFCAARAELVARVVRPALASGSLVVCDRYADSTLAYQGHGRGVPIAWLQTVIGGATDGLAPDLTIVLDLPAEVGLARRRREGEWNRLDAEDIAFHQRVRAGFLALAAAAPERLVVVASGGTVDDVADAVWNVVRPRVGA
jgi:dTMP kinase